MKKQTANAVASIVPVSSDKLGRVRAIVAPLTVAAPFVAVASISELRRYDVDGLAALITSARDKVTSRQSEIGKMLVALDEKRDGKGTLQAFVRKLVGEIDSTAYKCAIAFGMVGEGSGFVPESDFDAVPVRWKIVVSAILNLLEKAKDDILTAGTRAEVAVIMHARPADGYKTLANIKKCLLPEPVKSDGEGNGETDEESKAPETAPDFLTGDHIKAIRAQLETCADAATLELMAQGFSALAAIAQGQREELASVPVAA